MRRRGEPIENAAYLEGSDCGCGLETDAMAIYQTRREAIEKIMYRKDTHQVIPVTITYALPSRSKPKKKR